MFQTYYTKYKLIILSMTPLEGKSRKYSHPIFMKNDYKLVTKYYILIWENSKYLKYIQNENTLKNIPTATYHSIHLQMFYL